VVADHSDDVDRQVADPPAVEQIDQAVVERRDHDQHATAFARGAHLQVCAEVGRG